MNGFAVNCSPVMTREEFKYIHTPHEACSVASARRIAATRPEMGLIYFPRGLLVEAAFGESGLRRRLLLREAGRFAAGGLARFSARSAG